MTPIDATHIARPAMFMIGRRVVAELSGTGRLADDLYLMAHHEVSGKPFLPPRTMGLGLAGGLLAELALEGRLLVWPDRVVVSGSAPAEDGLASAVLGQVLSEPAKRPAREWLVFLGRTAEADVAGRLEQSGYLTQAAARLRWRAVRWVPVDPDCAFAPLTRVLPALKPSGTVTDQSAMLAGLADACGLGIRLDMYGPPNARSYLAGTLQQLGPDLRELIAQTQAVVYSAVLSSRA
jgi:Golgi phosphoprotein 3 (GPP34)